MGYDPSSHMVRGDYFTDDERLKWKYTEAMNMYGLWDFMQPHHAVAIAVARKFPRLASGYVVVVLKPYHRFKYPVMLNSRQISGLLNDIGSTWGSQLSDALVDGMSFDPDLHKKERNG